MGGSIKMVDGARGISWAAIQGRLLHVCTKETEEEYAAFLEKHRRAGTKPQPHEFAAGRVLSPVEVARLERRRQFFGNEYSG